MECQGLTSTDSKVYPEQTNLACCGKENCNLVACDGYISVQAPTGLQTCCGYEDGHDKECSHYTSTVNIDTGETVACCGYRDCYTKHCNEYLTGLFGICCGYKDCLDREITIYQDQVTYVDIVNYINGESGEFCAEMVEHYGKHNWNDGSVNPQLNKCQKFNSLGYFTSRWSCGSGGAKNHAGSWAKFKITYQDKIAYLTVRIKPNPNQ